ncbi:MAG: hypothetical protein IJS89_04390 [Bacteroidaceae bacterium]|nr:hypothetical protein [Bacteroidaceae bacterium]
MKRFLFALLAIGFAMGFPRVWAQAPNDGEACFQMADSLEKADGCRDSIEHYWRLAKEAGHADAHKRLSAFYLKMSEELRETDRDAARRYKMKWADEEATPMAYRKAAFFLRNKSIPESKDSVAHQYFYKAATAEPKDVFGEAWCYEFGYGGFVRDVEKAKGLYSKLFDSIPYLDDPELFVESRYRYALCIELKTPAEKKDTAAMRFYYEQAAWQKHPGANLALGIYYYNSKYANTHARVKQYLGTALEGIATDSLSAGYAAWYIGVCYANAYCGYEKNTKKAREHLLIAEACHIPEAKAELQKIDAAEQGNTLNNISQSYSDSTPANSNISEENIRNLINKKDKNL